MPVIKKIELTAKEAFSKIKPPKLKINDCACCLNHNEAQDAFIQRTKIFKQYKK